LDASKGVHDLLRLPVLGGTLVPVAHNVDSAPSFFADGKAALFQRNNSPEHGSTEFYSLNLETSEEKRLCTYKDAEYRDSAKDELRVYLMSKTLLSLRIVPTGLPLIANNLRPLKLV